VRRPTCARSPLDRRDPELHRRGRAGLAALRVLGFLDSAFYDDVLQEKEHYDGPAVELVAVEDDQIVGLLDLELEPANGVLHDTDARGGVIWHVAVHPDPQK
jgi:hypothetical protein